jgi:hypothetical protein
MPEVLSDCTFEDQHRHPLITRTILFLLQWLTLQRGSLEVFITILTNSGMDLRLLLCGAGELDKQDNSHEVN